MMSVIAIYSIVLRLLGAPVLPLFVFDGPKRPSTKREKKIKIIEDTQLNDVRELITAFGFECVTVSNMLSWPGSSS